MPPSVCFILHTLGHVQAALPHTLCLSSAAWTASLRCSAAARAWREPASASRLAVRNARRAEAAAASCSAVDSAAAAASRAPLSANGCKCSASMSALGLGLRPRKVSCRHALLLALYAALPACDVHTSSSAGVGSRLCWTPTSRAVVWSSRLRACQTARWYSTDTLARECVEHKSQNPSTLLACLYLCTALRTHPPPLLFEYDTHCIRTLPSFAAASNACFKPYNTLAAILGRSSMSCCAITASKCTPSCSNNGCVAAVRSTGQVLELVVPAPTRHAPE